jgi:putative transposase
VAVDGRARSRRIVSEKRLDLQTVSPPGLNTTVVGGAMPRFNLLYHFVWATNARRPLITAGLHDALYSSIVAKAVELDTFVHAVGGMEEHVHLVVQARPTLTPSTFIGQVKGYSSHSMNLLKAPVLQERFQWQAEYSVDSVSERGLRDVVRYVECQREHHALGTLLSYFEDW